MKKVLFIVANVGFQDHEFSVPYEAVKNAGYEVEIALVGEESVGEYL